MCTQLSGLWSKLAGATLLGRKGDGRQSTSKSTRGHMQYACVHAHTHRYIYIYIICIKITINLYKTRIHIYIYTYLCMMCISFIIYIITNLSCCTCHFGLHRCPQLRLCTIPNFTINGWYQRSTYMAGFWPCWPPWFSPAFCVSCTQTLLMTPFFHANAAQQLTPLWGRRNRLAKLWPLPLPLLWAFHLWGTPPHATSPLKTWKHESDPLVI